MTSLATYAERIDALTLRERGFLMTGVLAVTYFLWSGFLMQPMDQRHRDLRVTQERVAAELAAVNAQTKAALDLARNDPNETYRRELESLKAELAQLNRELAGTTDHLVPPDRMAGVLERVLQQAAGLQLLEMTSLGSSPLVPAGKSDARTAAEQETKADAAQEPAAVRTVYRHGVTLRLQGGFFEVNGFLRKLEALEWKFFWDAIEYRVLDYPDAMVELTLFTISLEPTWIGG
jgi:MSHA biogenesis protein MshJ